MERIPLHPSRHTQLIHTCGPNYVWYCAGMNAARTHNMTRHGKMVRLPGRVGAAVPTLFGRTGGAAILSKIARSQWVSAGRGIKTRPLTRFTRHLYDGGPTPEEQAESP